MADALCGPSNPLQSFRKHTQLDRTLQQDRLIGRQSPSQGFRTHDPRTGALDADLHAFEHGQPVNPLQFQQQPPLPQQQHLVQRSPSAGWAADFQRLHISNSPSPIPVQQFRTEAPLIRTHSPAEQNGGWHNEFMLHHSKGKEIAREMTPSYQQPSTSMYMPQNFPMGGQFQSPMLDQQQQQQHHNHIQQPDTTAADPAFDAAFEEAMREIEASQTLEQDQHSTTLNQPQQESQHLDTLQPSPTIRIGSDAIPYTDLPDRTLDQDTRDADELARTAGQLLTLVSHDTSTKFQNSQFLDLMRKIRDREVEVMDNDLQSTSTAQIQAEPPRTTATSAPTHNDRQGQQGEGGDDASFSFPSLDAVYAPSQADFDTDTYPAGSWQHQRGAIGGGGAGGGGNASDADQMYTAAGDEFGSSGGGNSHEHSALHPGGRWYPEQLSPRMGGAEMAGGAGAGAGAGGQA